MVLGGGESTDPTIGPLETGYECVVSEIAPVDPNGLWAFNDPILLDSSGDTGDGTVVIEAKGQTYTVTVTNTIYRLKGSLTVTKQVENTEGANLDGITFPINVTCTYNGDETANEDFDLEAGGSQTVKDKIGRAHV